MRAKVHQDPVAEMSGSFGEEKQHPASRHATMMRIPVRVALCISLVSCRGPQERTEPTSAPPEGKYHVTATLQDGPKPQVNFCIISAADVSLPRAFLPWASDRAVSFAFSRIDPDIPIEVGSRQRIDWDLTQLTVLPAGKRVCGPVDLSERVEDLERERRAGPILVAWAYPLPPLGTPDRESTVPTWATGALVLVQITK